MLKDKSDQIAIIDTRDNRMKQTATITVEDVSEIQEMYLDIERNQLIAVCDGYVGGKWNDDDYGYGQRANTTAVTYDISDRENPKRSWQGQSEWILQFFKNCRWILILIQ